MEPILTIGMATFDDFHGTYFTIQSLRLHHPEIMDKVEILVIDNNPDGKHGSDVRGIINHINSTRPNFQARYIPHKESVGTSASRERIFTEARGKFVLCTDCHVIFPGGALAKLVEYLEANPDESAIMHGPLLYDDLRGVATHFNEQWRSEMWGTWGAAWADKTGAHFTVIDNGGKCKYVNLIDGKTEVAPLFVKSGLDWAGHERILMGSGCRNLGKDPSEPPFDIPGQGLGVFVCAKEHWSHFNPDCRGFGGEEIYIHKKHRAAGKRVLLLPFLRWLHRFGRPDGVKYPLTLWNKVRNYVLEFQEMGWDLQEVYNHFVIEQKRLTQDEWNLLISNAKTTLTQPSAAHWREMYSSPEKIVEKVKTEKPLASIHMDLLKKYSEQVDDVLDIGVNVYTTIATFVGTKKSVVSYTGVPDDPTLHKLMQLPDNKQISVNQLETLDYSKLQPADLISIDYTPEGQVLTQVFNNIINFNLAKRFIVIHNTKAFGEFSPSKGYGLMVAIRFFLKQHPEYTVIEHIHDGAGITVLSKDERDKTALPKFTEMVGNLFGAVKSYVAEGAGMVSKEVFEARLATCAICPHRNNNRCGLCGCFLESKGRLAGNAGVCPIGKWAEVERSLE